MTFVYEKLTEQDWEKYPSLDLKGLDGWYVDKERDVSIWGGPNARGWQDYADGYEGFLMKLRVGQRLVQFVIEQGEGSAKVTDVPFYIVWNRLISYEPKDLYGLDFNQTIDLLREALNAFGGGYEDNTKWHPNFVVQFNF